MDEIGSIDKSTGMRQIWLLFYLNVVSFSLVGQTYDAGEVYKGTNDYVSYHAGNLPLILSVSHGGLLEPSVIPDRSCANCVTSNDINTRALGLSVLERIKTITGCEAHLIVNELRRIKLDANRAIGEAALGNAEAELAWTEYHAFIDSAKVEVTRSWNSGLVIDLHGHGHDIQRLELGYRLNGSALRMSDEALDAMTLESSPIRHLINSTDLTLSQAVRGQNSLGAFFTAKGYPSVPSVEIPNPEVGEPFFQGGYITDRYGSKDGSSIDAIQIECHQDIRFVPSAREQFADSLAVVLIEFMERHYHMNLFSGTCQPTNVYSAAITHPVVQIYPNPVCGEINVQLDKDPENIMVFNNLGQVVLKDGNTRMVDLGMLSNGIYHLLVSASDIWYRQRLSVQCND